MPPLFEFWAKTISKSARRDPGGPFSRPLQVARGPCPVVERQVLEAYPFFRRRPDSERAGRTVFCPVDGANRGGRPPSLIPRPRLRAGPDQGTHCTLFCAVVFCLEILFRAVTRPSPSRCTLRSCVISPYAHPWPRTPADQVAHASGLLLTPPRAMRCEPDLFGCRNHAAAA